ncbi:hypothetical protein [Salipiger mucosus]|uniref:Sulfotransferase family protein n=1 Tax=Salipiger mucosus DSM 16094 TaxID=1123237 RepID=S9QKR9_9RHOB|nr:hypothetical protein [Salipiger mucosus]EPX80392.1 hypothetical protein Salmuc_03708 [Salipiger mucosus DSM 16094]
MIGQAFADTGWHLAPTGAPITRYQVFGERCSGTNFVKRLIGRNTALTPIEDLGWKHGFPHMTAIPEDCLVVCVVRHAGDWARSVHAKPWHCPPAMQRLPFPEFIRAEWATVADRPRYFPQVAQLGGKRQPLQHDRHPITGRPFPNLFALRRAKLEALLGFGARGCAVLLCRLEAVQAAPEDFLRDLRGTLSLPAAEYRPVVKRLGSRFAPAVEDRPPTPDSLSPEDLAFMRAQLVPDLEAALGYRY